MSTNRINDDVYENPSFYGMVSLCFALKNCSGDIKCVWFEKNSRISGFFFEIVFLMELFIAYSPFRVFNDKTVFVFLKRRIDEFS